MATRTETSPIRPLRADARRNRERVLAAAREAFAEVGMEAQMDDVARRAGVGVGTVYRHFPTKDELVIALATQFFTQLGEIAREEAERQDAWEAFTSLLRRGSELNAHDLGMQDVIMRGIGNEAVERAKSEVLALTRDIVERAQEQGDLREDFHYFDVPMITCGVSASQRMPFGAQGAWKRHLELTIAGMRAGAGPPLPPR